jgi:hypothetical protein
MSFLINYTTQHKENKTMETKEIIVVTYPNGHTEAYYRHDPALLELFICEHDIIEDVIVAELKQPKEETKENG